MQKQHYPWIRWCLRRSLRSRCVSLHGNRQQDPHIIDHSQNQSGTSQENNHTLFGIVRCRIVGPINSKGTTGVKIGQRAHQSMDRFHGLSGLGCGTTTQMANVRRKPSLTDSKYGPTGLLEAYTNQIESSWLCVSRVIFKWITGTIFMLEWTLFPTFNGRQMATTTLNRSTTFNTRQEKKNMISQYEPRLSRYFSKILIMENADTRHGLLVALDQIQTCGTIRIVRTHEFKND